ncbi:putative transposase [Mycobacterium avium MAV_120809_2495]|nr:putative transposase [Mycobacterium avium MAV_120809_2495]
MPTSAKPATTTSPPEFRDTLTDQLADVQALRTDAECRGWTDEAARHDRVAHALTDHLQRLDR